MEIDVDEVLSICDDFLKVPCVIENEIPFLDYLDDKISGLGYETLNKKEYLVVLPKNNVNDYLFSIHIDRHGIVRNDEGEFEYAAYKFKKRYDLEFKRDYYEAHLINAQRFVNESCSSYDSLSGEIISDYFIDRFDIDSKSKLISYDFDKKSTKNEEVFMLNSKIKRKENIFSAQIDNVISAAVMFYLLKHYDFGSEVIFTTREEIGLSWRCVMDYLDSSEKILDIMTLDTSPYENFKEKTEGFLTLREGDENGSFNLDILKKLKNLCDDLGIGYNLKSSGNGMTELGRISYESSGKYNGVTLQLPTMNYHTTYESASYISLRNYVRVIKSLGLGKGL